MSLEKQKVQGPITTEVFLDKKDAFDNVPHDAIIDSLEDLVIGRRLYSCIFSYLTGIFILIST